MNLEYGHTQRHARKYTLPNKHIFMHAHMYSTHTPLQAHTHTHTHTHIYKLAHKYTTKTYLLLYQIMNIGVKHLV